MAPNIIEKISRFFYFIPVLFMLFLLPGSSATGLNITTDQSALLSLRTRITSDPYGLLENWTISNPVCNWIGVICDSRHHRVTALNFSNMDLIGEIPPQFGNLSFLVSLDMRNNHFTGVLPSEFARLRRLKFSRLSYNSFTGEVPSSFAFLRKLQLLSLRNNSFTDLNVFLNSISNATKLETLDISFNDLQGNIPESIGNLRNLKALSLGNNQFSGFIPSSLGNISGLETLIISENSIQGKIPENFVNFHNLTWLNMESNQFTGSIPFGIFNISMLELVSFTNNSLSGTLPDDMCLRLPMLQGLYLSDNEMHGQIPSNLSACAQLQTLSLSNNNFTGNIPTEIRNLEMLEILYLGFNMLTGTIPREVGELRNLQLLGMEHNMLRGTIPSSIFNLSSLQRLSLADNQLNDYLSEDFGNLTMLVELYLGDNNFTGVVPQSFSQLQELQALDLGTNSLSGFIPSNIFNISGLRLISLTGNNLSGNLPSNIGYLLPNLGELYIGGNNFDGILPTSIINSSELTVLDLSENRFTGSIPYSLGELRLLQVLNLENNNFTSESVSPELSFITSLVNCRYLTELAVSYNPLNGILPVSFGNLSSSLHTIYASECQIDGHLPDEIGNLTGLVSLYLYGNNLAGFIPTTLHGLQNLQRLSLGNNQIRGFIPNSLCGLNNLGAVLLSQNQLTGPIPECLGNVSSLRQIHLDSNNFSSNIPGSIWNLQDILELDISSNSFTGSLSPQIGNMKAATYINLSVNHFENNLPNNFQDLQNLITFSLANNRFQGQIPESMGAMLDLVYLDLSHNNLSGVIPNSLESLIHLEYFNVSFNELSGEIPTGGSFSNFTSQSFLYNTALCGLPKYQVSSCKVSKHKKIKKELKIAFIILGIAALVVTVILTLIIIRYRMKNKPPTVSDVSVTARIERFSYYGLLQATNGFSESNLLGKGSFGSVYKGVFRDGKTFAVKVFNMQVEEALKTFDAECEVLRNLRHRNLTKVFSSCSNEDFKALILEYMPNGSLENWLYSNENTLSIMQRLNMMIDVASALEYLHHGYSIPVVHCDLKPSNVLLDEHMMARVSDFGIAKLLGEGESITHTMTLATMGYMAPEYGSDGLVSTRGDVYSYGIMLLETFTRKRPSDEMFSGETNLKNWVEDSLPDGLTRVIDASLIRPDEDHVSKKLHCISSILELALSCLADSPRERMNMQQVVVELKKIKNQFSAHNKETSK